MITLENKYQSDGVLLKDLEDVDLILFTPLDGGYEGEVFITLGTLIKQAMINEWEDCSCINIKNNKNEKLSVCLKRKVKQLNGVISIKT